MTASPYSESRPTPIPYRWYWIRPAADAEFRPAYRLHRDDHLYQWDGVRGMFSDEEVADWYLIPPAPPDQALLWADLPSVGAIQ
jgi:hypothetical protein